MDEYELDNASDEKKSTRVEPMDHGETGWDAHWRWLSEHGNVPDGMSQEEYREMVADWQDFVELNGIWGR